ANFTVILRRTDLAGQDAAVPMQLPEGTALVPPGRWEVALAPNTAWDVRGFRPHGSPRLGTTARPDRWNQFLGAGHGDAVAFTLSPSPGAVHGLVTAENHEPVAGVPVFLEALGLDRSLRPLDIRSVRTDMHGQYRFEGVTPGSYRVLATFEYQTVD